MVAVSIVIVLMACIFYGFNDPKSNLGLIYDRMELARPKSGYTYAVLIEGSLYLDEDNPNLYPKGVAVTWKWEEYNNTVSITGCCYDEVEILGRK